MSLMEDCCLHLSRAADAAPDSEHGRLAQLLLEKMAARHNAGIAPSLGGTAGTSKELPKDSPWHDAATRWNAGMDPRAK